MLFPLRNRTCQQPKFVPGLATFDMTAGFSMSTEFVARLVSLFNASLDEFAVVLTVHLMSPP
jgi:hypothetical protein